MAHRCTNCGELIEDGDEQLFNGCNNCNQNTFEFAPNPDEEIDSENPLGVEQSTDEEEEIDEDELREEIREELNSQFSSIRIVEEGKYEINLDQLYRRDICIIEVKSDGSYVLEKFT